MYFPMEEDSTPGIYPIILLDRTVSPPVFANVPLGQGFNQQPFVNKQSVMVLEQEFMVAEAAYVPMPLNTLYDPAWSCGWQGTFVGLGNLFLVDEGPLVGVGGGIARLKRKFVNLPPNWNEYESYPATFPPLDNGADVTRLGFSRIVNCRLFYQYFVFDNNNLLPGIPLFPAGNRINTAQESFDVLQFLLWEAFQGYQAVANSVILNMILEPEGALSDNGDGQGTPTVPGYTDYNSWIRQAEIVAEASSFKRWMGNIWVKCTRFVVAT